jgi:urease accessory protein
MAALAANRAVTRIALEVHAETGRTRVGRLHEEGALRVRFPGPSAQALEAVIVNTAGGMAGGDRIDLEIVVHEGANLTVTTVAAEKVYRSLGTAAVVRVRLKVGAGARLAWLPQETILFDRARMDRRIEVELAETAQLLLVEAVVFGRAGMGEHLSEGSFRDRWRIRRGGRLVLAEAVRLEGPIAGKLAAPAIARGGRAVATAIAVPGDESRVERVRSIATFCGEVGVSSWNGLVAARLVAPSGEALRHDLAAVLGALCSAALPRLWLNENLPPHPGGAGDSERPAG